MIRILHLEDDPRDAELIMSALGTEGTDCQMERVASKEDFMGALEREEFDLILPDFKMPGFDGISALAAAQERKPNIPFIFVSGTIGEEAAIRCLKRGATDYVLKGHLERLVTSVRRAIREGEERKERLHSEEQLRASFKKVGDLNTEIRNFYHTLSHELKTPLTSAREFVSIVMDGLAGPLNPTQLEYLGMAKESCDQLRLYINDLLDVTRLETGQISMEFHPLSLAALVERVVETLAPAASGKGVILSCDCQPHLPAISLDKQRILQVLTNLTINAINFTPAGGQIRLVVRQAPADPEYLQVDVHDTGVGVPKDQLDAIFNRLYQASHKAQPMESRNGLGLGLYICHELVHLHGGRIWVESEVGKGSIFSFIVPKQGMKKGPHVLIVDDDQTTRASLRLLLEDQNFEVTTAEGGRRALQMMSQKTPAVVVLDLMMGGLDGPSTLKEIRMNWGLIPVIVYTGCPDSEHMRQAIESSPFTLLAKPCAAKHFVETVRQMCHSSRTQFLRKNDKASPALVAPSL